MKSDPRSRQEDPYYLFKIEGRSYQQTEITLRPDAVTFRHHPFN